MTEEPKMDEDKDGLPDQVETDVWRSRRKMAWVALFGIIVPTVFIILRISDVGILDKLADLMSWYYLGLSSIVGAFFGFTTWASIKGRGKIDG
jgi:hypothetical protein